MDWEEASRTSPDAASPFNSFTMVPKQMSTKQLQQGIYWLIWNLSRLQNVARRLERFFDTYETGPRRPSPAPSTLPRLETLGILFRLGKHLLLHAGADERRGLFTMLGHALRSSHPQRFEIAVLAFLSAVNSQEILLAEEPGIDGITCPTQEPST